MAFQWSYFKSWKMMLWKCCTQYVRKFGKLSSGHRTGKGQFSFQSQRKAMPKSAQTTTQLHSSHTTEDEMAGWHHRLNGHEFGWTPGVGDGQGGLACCNSWGCRVGYDWVTELNWTHASKSNAQNSPSQASAIHELLIGKFRLELKKVGKNTRPFRYDLNQISYDYTGFPGGAEVKASACNVGDLGRSLGQEDPLQKEMTTYSSILAWRIPWTEELGGLQSTGCKESDTTERLHITSPHLMIIQWK